MVDGVAGEGDQAPGADTAGHEIGGPGVFISLSQETAEDAHPFAVTEMELVGCKRRSNNPSVKRPD